MRRQPHRAGSGLLGIGAALIAVAVVASVGIRVAERQSARRAERVVQMLTAAMPTVQNGAPGDRDDAEMPRIELDGTDYVGLVEIPAYGVVRPIGAAWKKSRLFWVPCRYSGCAYDGSLIVGGSDRTGQLDCLRKMTVGDAIYVTDTVGTRYAYRVTDIVRTTDVSAERLASQAADLVVFARNTDALDYTVVCARFWID